MSDLGYRPLGFESDIGNRNFAGAQDPDALLHAEFYWYEPIDKNKTEEESVKQERHIIIRAPKQIYIRISKPGDQTSVIETPAREDHKRRWPQKWLYFQIQEGLVDAGANQPGWKIEEKMEGMWELTEEEVHQLKFLRFYTVEQIAGASDGQIGNIMGGLGLRKRAQDAVKARATSAVREELEAKQKEINDMKERMAKMEAMMSEMAKPQDRPQQQANARR